MISRREAIYGAFATLLASSTLSAQDDDWQSALAEAIRNKSPLTLGRVLPPPNDVAWKEAHAILSSAPLTGTPFEVAQYFVTSVAPKYQRAWPEPDPAHPTLANPLIVLFFLATHTTPSGDTTAWCSAFVNWCLARVGIRGTMNASSQSFADLGWGEEVWNRSNGEPMPTTAKPGDLAIFQRLSDPQHGHICFFSKISEQQPKSIEVLGGNQILIVRGHKLHLIDITTLRIDGDLKLRCVRTKRGLRHE